MLPINDTLTNTGIAQQARILAGVDATQWPFQRIVNSGNSYKDFLTGYAIAADKRFQWDNTQHTKLPEGTTPLTINQSDYSFLTDEQGNTIITLTGVGLLQNGQYTKLSPVDRSDPNYDPATFGMETGTPTQYDKISDNIIRLDKKPVATVAAGLKFYFQRTAPRWTASSTTQTSGFSPILDRGFVIACAYDIALTLGLSNLQGLALERQREEDKAVAYFENRQQDEDVVFTPSHDMISINTSF
jgi:hypothetical protein